MVAGTALSSDKSQRASVARSRKQQRTQWTAQFLVASELARNGYTVSFTMGNHTPVADLMVGCANGTQFWVDVKGLSSSNAWVVKPKERRHGLYYVLTRVGDKRADDRFFILTQEEANRTIQHYQEKHQSAKHEVSGFNFNDAMPFEGAWRKLPEWPDKK